MYVTTDFRFEIAVLRMSHELVMCTWRCDMTHSSQTWVCDVMFFCHRCENGTRLQNPTDYTDSSCAHMGWLRSVGSIRLWVSFAEYRLFYRALLQKRPTILSILLTKATPYMCTWRVGVIRAIWEADIIYSHAAQFRRCTIIRGIWESCHMFSRVAKESCHLFMSVTNESCHIFIYVAISHTHV